MDIRKLALVIITLALAATTAFSKALQEWYPYTIGKDIDSSSPLNIGKLVLDAPAGNHGFVKAKDGHFYFEDGTRARFWGTNLCFNANFPTHKQAEQIAGRIAFFGFNAVRLHHMDYYHEPDGIFENTVQNSGHEQRKTTGKLSKKQLDKLDYLIYQLKLRGIYIDMNLLVSRRFTEADGVKEVEALGIAAKPASIFDPKLIELQKQYAKDLLTHYNPYTKLKYNQDPAIALIEITNENSVLHSWKNNNLNNVVFKIKRKSLPEYYTKQLDNKWNEWLRIKYSTPEKTKSTWETVVTASSSKLPAVKHPSLKLADWNLELINGVAASSKVKGNTAVIKVEKVADTPWHIQFKQNKISVRKGKNYVFKFTAKAKQASEISVICQQSSSPWNNLGLSESVEVTGDFQAFEVPFTANEDSDNAKLGFILGYKPDEIAIKDISFQELSEAELLQDNSEGFNFTRPFYKLRFLYPKKMIADLENFYAWLEKEYFNSMINYLKDNLQIKCALTGGQYSPVEVEVSFDFIDRHAYWDHPRFPRRSWDLNDFVIHNRSVLLDKELGIINWLARDSKLQLKPFTVTEWNLCYPNQFAYEMPILLAGEAQKNGWDGLFQFAFSHGWKPDPEFNDIHSYFDIIANPQQLILCSLGSFIFLKEENTQTALNNGIYSIKTDSLNAMVGFIKDVPLTLGPFTVTADQNGAIILIKENDKYFLFAVSEVKNSGSGWNKDKKFIWGHSPVLLKRINVAVQLNGRSIPTDFSKSPWTKIKP